MVRAFFQVFTPLNHHRGQKNKKLKIT